MPIKLYDSKDAVPADQREKAYETKEGKWVAEEVDPNFVSSAAQETIRKEREARAEQERLRKEAETKLAAAEREKAAGEKGVTKEQLDKLREEDAAARKPLEERLSKLETENKQLLRDRDVRTVALKAGVMETRIDKAMKDTSDRIELTADGKGYVVKNAKGEPTTESVEDFFAKTYKEEAPFFYAGSGGSGSGADGGSGGGGGSAYDPAAAGKKAAEAQKAAREKNELAFK